MKLIIQKFASLGVSSCLKIGENTFYSEYPTNAGLALEINQTLAELIRQSKTEQYYQEEIKKTQIACAYWKRIAQEQQNKNLAVVIMAGETPGGN